MKTNDAEHRAYKSMWAKAKRKDPAFVAKGLENSRRWWATHKDEPEVKARNIASTKAYTRAHPAKRRQRSLSMYGMTLGDYDARVSKQNGTCAICGDRPVNRPLFVDHDHVTGKIRGLLCLTCNSGLGHFRDSTDRLQKAISYLEAQ